MNSKKTEIEANVRNNDITPDKNSKLKSTKCARKRKRRNSSTDEEELDLSIDVKLKQSAMRNNLTPQNVKNILQKVVRNDHVLAIVKLKEEELERREKAMKDSKTLNDKTTEESELNHEPLTRAKAKALNQYPLPVAPYKHLEPNSEVVALIREELHSDDDDEEYQPGEDDIESDDEINTTVSDIDSQPATPSSQADASEDPQTTIYTQDGLFKIPRLRNDSTTSQSEQEYKIAERTRSKISLAETPIEEIESTFKAPDAPMDMYHTEHDVDPNWIQFLNNFTMPLALEIEKEEKDEDADPDYCPMIVDNQPDDREEFQQVNVSKKEVNDLLNDWCSCIDLNFLDFNDLDGLTLDTSSSKHLPTTSNATNESLVTPVKQIDESVITPEPNQNQTKSDMMSSNPGISYFDPISISTPAKPNYNNNSIPTIYHQTQQQSFDTFNNTLFSVNESGFSYTSPRDKSTVLVPVMTFTTNSNASPNQLASPYNVYVTIPPETTATTPAMSSTVISSIQSNNNNNQIIHLSQQIEAGRVVKRPGCRAKRSRFKSAAYRELDNLDPNAIVPKIFYSANERGFTSEQHLILESQLRIHVQLSTQSYLQTYGHPELYTEAHRVKRFLIELMDIVDKNTSISIFNIKPAMELIASWENELSTNTKENSELFTYLKEEMNKLRKNAGYTMQFHERILKVICASKVFIYPELLPAIPFRLKTSKPSEYFPAEDYLLAFLLEHFFEELQRKVISYKFARPKEVTLTSVSHHISAHLNYLRHWKSIYDYIRLRRDGELMNPIKFFFKHRRAPPIRHRYELFNPDLIIEPAKQPLTVLSSQWARYVEKLIGFKYDEVLQNTITLPLVLNTLNSKRKAEKKNITTEQNNGFTVKNVQNNTNDNNNSLIQVTILYEDCGINISSDHEIAQHGTLNSYGHKSDINDNSERLIKGQTLLTSYFHPVQKSSNAINYNDLADSVELAIEKKSLLECNKQIHKKYRRLNVCKHLIRQQTQQFLIHLILKARKNYSPHWHRFQRKKIFAYLHRCIVTYHLFTAELINKHKVPKVSANMNIEALVTNRRVQKFLTDNAGSNTREITEENVHAIQQSDVGAKRLPKSQRTSDSTRLLLLSENAQESSEKDCLFAQRFMDRVEETFLNENKHHKFTEFLNILRKFSENQQQLTGAHLYLTLEKFLEPDYPELMELFLSFLLPSDAVEINKSMDYFLKVNSIKFLNKLNIFFQKQPAQIRKVLACLKELSEDPDVTIDRIRLKVLPLLKGNQLLIDWFLQCIAPDKCESGKDEYETLVLRKGNESFDDDQCEYIPQSEIASDPNENPCHIRYMNGRIFYGNRYPLPAKLSFSATPCSSSAVDLIEPEKQLHMGSGDKVLHYQCTHNIKEFADSKMRDRHHSELEHTGISGSIEDIDNSDDEQHYTIAADKIDEKTNADEETSEPINPTYDHVLCDNNLLRAHSIRLNPSLHTPLIHSNVDILNKLKQPEQLSSDTNREFKLSPKKQATAKQSTIVQAKLSQVRKINSLNMKKVALGGSKSPNNKKNVALLSTAMQNDESGSTLQTIQQDSNFKTKAPKSHMLSKPIKKQKRSHVYYDAGDEGELVEEFVKKDELIAQNDNDTQKTNTPLAIQWTREEDRLLLEQIKAGLDCFANKNFADRFENKTQDQIRDRILFLIDFLTKLRNKQN